MSVITLYIFHIACLNNQTAWWWLMWKASTYSWCLLWHIPWLCSAVIIYVLTVSLLTQSLPHLGKYFFNKNVGALTGKKSGTSILCSELPLNPRNRVALHLTVQCQTLMQRTGHILRTRGNPRDWRETTYVTVHTDWSPMIMLVCWPARKSAQPSLVHHLLVIIIFLLCTAVWGNVCQGITGVCILTFRHQNYFFNFSTLCI